MVAQFAVWLFGVLGHPQLADASPIDIQEEEDSRGEIAQEKVERIEIIENIA